jgi:alpha-D-ribose 1-methylphosphonate 5-triphosphate synthase subunit PhnL
VCKDFIFHHQQGTQISVLENFSMKFFPGQTSVLTGPSGSGKSTLLRMIYASYRTGKGQLLVCHNGQTVDIATASPGKIYEIRRDTIGYVSQFLRVVPRVSALDTVVEPLILRNTEPGLARKKGKQILARLGIPKNLWHLSASTFSGGEQQRINLARGFIAPYPVLLLDEPTASLDPVNRAIVIELIQEAVEQGACVLGVFHNRSDQEKIADRTIDLSRKDLYEKKSDPRNPSANEEVSI